MNEQLDGLVATAAKNQEQAMELVEQLFAVAQPSAVFSEPVTVGDQTVITASEVKVGMTFGFGIGGGAGTVPAEGEAASEDEPQDERSSPAVGGGGGGGGVSGGRPVAVITIRPEGVEVEPVVDATKIALAFFTTLGSMFFMLSKMRKTSIRRG